MEKTASGVARARMRTRRFGPRALAIALTSALLGTLMVLGSDPASGRTIVNANASQDHVVSDDAFRIQVVAIGADGGSTSSATGGNGARVTTTVPVTPGETIRIFVNEGGGAGGQGVLVGEDGAAGGGASGIRRGTQNVVVAAGGGGAGGDALLTNLAGAGDGGNAPLANTGSGCAPGGDGNDGTLPPVTAGGGGGGGQCNAGGAGGTLDGQPGTANQGGAGGSPTVAGAGGGGGGGGHFGGGGGGSGIAGVLGGGGGGAGSSFVAGGTSNQIASNAGATTGSVVITELVGDTECSDEVDNDGDGPIDAEDPGCHTDADPDDGDDTYNPNDDSETNSQCSNGVDDADVEDTLVDAADPGCHTDGDATNADSYNPADNNEGNSGGTGNNNEPQCSDGADNDDPEDTLADDDDPGCHTDGDATNAASYDPDDDNEVNGAVPQCSDNVDNADPEDTLVDEQDPGCHTDGNPANAASYRPNDDNESNISLDDEGPPGSPTCTDGIDNDRDGLIDANDPGCQGGGGGGGGGRSDLTVTLDLNNASVKKGKTVGATVTVRNHGPSVARNVEVTTRLDKGKLRFKGVTGNGCTAPAPASNIVVCRITTLAVGESVNFTIEAKTKGSGKAKIETQAFLTQGEDRAPSDNVDREKVRINKKRGGRRR